MQPQSDWQILAFAGQIGQLRLQLGQQATGLTAVLFRFESGFVGLAAAFVDLLGHAAEGALDTRIDTAFPFTQTVVFRLQRIIVLLQAEHVAAHRLHLADQGGDRVAWGIARDAQRLGLLGGQLEIVLINRTLRRGSATSRDPGFQDDQHHGQQRPRYQPLEQRISFHCHHLAQRVGATKWRVRGPRHE
ncbi:hypothetical protein D9M71_384250 [compost metagenome]